MFNCKRPVSMGCGRVPFSASASCRSVFGISGSTVLAYGLFVGMPLFAALLVIVFRRATWSTCSASSATSSPCRCARTTGGLASRSCPRRSDVHATGIDHCRNAAQVVAGGRRQALSGPGNEKEPVELSIPRHNVSHRTDSSLECSDSCTAASCAALDRHKRASQRLRPPARQTQIAESNPRPCCVR